METSLTVIQNLFLNILFTYIFRRQNQWLKQLIYITYCLFAIILVHTEISCKNHLMSLQYGDWKSTH